MEIDIIWGAPVEREKDWQKLIVDTARRICGFTHIYHTLYAKGSEPGYPDLHLVHPQRGSIFLEVKGVPSQKSKITAEQIDWITVLQLSGTHAYITRPADQDAMGALLTGRMPLPDASIRDNHLLSAQYERTRL